MKSKQKAKEKTSPSSKITLKTIRDKLATTETSPIGITVQHDASQPSHPAPKKLLKNLYWKMSTMPEGSYPTISILELHEHIKSNRILYSPPVSINLTLKIIETLASSNPEEKVHYILEPKNMTALSSTGKVTHLQGSRATSPVRPSK